MSTKTDNDGFSITCGKCRNTSRLTDWVAATWGADVFTCPDCGHSFRREPVTPHPGYGKFVKLTPLAAGRARKATFA
jgi:hypothetical protein